MEHTNDTTEDLEKERRIAEDQQAEAIMERNRMIRDGEIDEFGKEPMPWGCEW